RAIRADMQVNATVSGDIVMQVDNTGRGEALARLEPVFRKVVRIGSFTAGTDDIKPPTSASGIAGRVTIYIPLEGVIDVDQEVERIEIDVQRLSGFFKRIDATLNNEKFMAGAPDQVVFSEPQKQADTQAKLERLNEIRSQLLE